MVMDSHALTRARDPHSLLGLANALARRLIRSVSRPKTWHLRAVKLVAFNLLRSSLVEILKSFRTLHLLRHLQILSIHKPLRLFGKEQFKLSIRLCCNLLRTLVGGFLLLATHSSDLTKTVGSLRLALLILLHLRLICFADFLDG